jgi:hypothetical protein
MFSSRIGSNDLATRQSVGPTFRPAFVRDSRAASGGPRAYDVRAQI